MAIAGDAPDGWDEVHIRPGWLFHTEEGRAYLIRAMKDVCNTDLEIVLCDAGRWRDEK